MHIAVLGPLHVDGKADGLAPRDRLVLAALTLHRGEAVGADVLADALWPGQPPPSWGKVVQGCVVRLRKALGAGAIETRPRGYCLVVPADEVDAYRFEALLVRGRELAGLGEPERVAFLVGEALALWRGPALVELAGWGPGQVAARRLEELRLDAEELWLDAMLGTGRCREVLAEAQARATEQPLREHRWALLAKAHYLAGRQSDALRTLRDARTMLARELGVDPGRDLVAMERAVLRQDPGLVAAVVPPAASAACPYLGLVPYDLGDTDAFFGRDSEVKECLHRLASVGALVVVGPSGSGKSSLVRAGVAAALRRERRRVVVITPGARPMDALTALPGSGPAPVLVVDQCEEVVSLCADPDERAQFFAALVRHVRRGPLVIALRADRLGEVSAYPELILAVERGLYLLKRMDDANLRAAIEGPARLAGLLCEPGLVDLMVRDVEGEPGALPLLSHALRETWRHREGRTMTVAGYRASGGIRGAVAQSAERLYRNTPADLQPVLRDLLLRLVATTPAGEPVRSRVPRGLLATNPERERMVESLVGARLVTSDEDVVELAHEALVRVWPRLAGWLDDDVEGQRMLRHVAAAAETWQAMARPDSELYRGVRLARAVAWWQRAAPELNPVERAFLDGSRRAAERERTAARRRRRALVSGLAAGLVIATALAVTAFVNQQQARQTAQLARSRELAAAAVVALDTDPSLAKLLALAAVDLAEPTIDTMSLLHRVFAADRVVDRYTWPGERPVHSLSTDLHPGGHRLVASGQSSGSSSYLEVQDLTRDEVVWSWAAPDPALVIDRPHFTGDGARVVAGVYWEPTNAHTRRPPRELPGAYVWDAETGELSHRVDLGRCGGKLLGLSDERMLVSTADQPGCFSGTDTSGDSLILEVVALGSGQRRVLTDRGQPHAAAMSADGRFVAFTEWSGSRSLSVVLDLATGDRVLEFDADQRHPTRVDDPGYVRLLNHDGSLLLAGDRPIAVWDVAAGEIIATFGGHAGEATPYLFARDGASVYSVGRAGDLLRWDPRSGEQIAAHPAVGAGRVSMADDGRVLVADPSSQRATLLDPGVHGEVWSLPTCGGFVLGGSLQAAGGYAAMSELCTGEPPMADAVTHVVDLAGRDVAYTLPGHAGQALALSPDGTRLLRQERGERPDGLTDPAEQTEQWVGAPLVRDLRTGRPLARLAGVCTWQNRTSTEVALRGGCNQYPEVPFAMWTQAVAWSPDSSLVAVGGTATTGPGPTAVWDSGTGELVRTIHSACPGWAIGLTFSPDGEQLLLSCTDPPRMVVVSTETWDVLRSVDLDATLESTDLLRPVGYTPDETELMMVSGASGTGAGAVHWIDSRTLQITHTLPRVHDGSPKSVAMSADRTLAATGSSDGFVKIWAVAQRRLVQEIYIGNTQAQGVAFLDERHLAVAPETGGLFVYTLDPGELVRVVRASLTRGFTPAECQRFDFSGTCPSLAELTGSG